MTYIDEIFNNEKLWLHGVLPFGACKIIKPRLISEMKFTARSVIMLCAPYLASDAEIARNVSLYALPRDYHLYFSELFSRIIPLLTSHFGGSFAGYADHSPIDEIDAAAKCDLGVLGDNGLLITERWGSYVFIGEIYSDIPPEIIAEGEAAIHPLKRCPGCGRCAAACPQKNGRTEECLSALTQKKGELSDSALREMRSSGIIWGCDICQTACPMNSYTAKTPIEFFKSGIKPYASSKDDISDRAYSWRGKKVIDRNIDILNGDKYDNRENN